MNVKHAMAPVPTLKSRRPKGDNRISAEIRTIIAQRSGPQSKHIFLPSRTASVSVSPR